MNNFSKLCYILFILTLSGCSTRTAATMKSTSEAVEQKTPVVIPKSTPTEYDPAPVIATPKQVFIHSAVNTSEDWHEVWTVQVPISKTAGMDEQQIVEMLFQEWLDQYNLEQTAPDFQVKQFQIDGATPVPASQYSPTDYESDSLYSIRYSVQPTDLTSGRWMAGDGTYWEHTGWVEGKVMYVGLHKTQSYYELRTLGHCLGC